MYSSCGTNFSHYKETRRQITAIVVVAYSANTEAIYLSKNNKI